MNNSDLNWLKLIDFLPNVGVSQSLWSFQIPPDPWILVQLWYFSICFNVRFLKGSYWRLNNLPNHHQGDLCYCLLTKSKNLNMCLRSFDLQTVWPIQTFKTYRLKRHYRNNQTQKSRTNMHTTPIWKTFEMECQQLTKRNTYKTIKTGHHGRTSKIPENNKL